MEILATLDDVNANLDDNVAVATNEDIDLLQISIARIVRGSLAQIVDNVVLQSWRTPEHTPEIIRECAGKLIAAQHYFNHISKSNGLIQPDSFAQKRYDEGMAILNGIIAGTITIIGDETDVTASQNISTLDFFPIDATDRAFTMGQPF